MEPLTAQTDMTGTFVMVSIVMVVICLAALALIKWVFPRFIRAPLYRRGGPIRVLARHSLEPRLALYVLKIGGKHLVVGAGDKGLSMLCELGESDLPEDWKR